MKTRGGLKNRLSNKKWISLFFFLSLVCSPAVHCNITLVFDNASLLQRNYTKLLGQVLLESDVKSPVVSLQREDFNKTFCPKGLIVLVGAKSAAAGVNKCPESDLLFTFLDLAAYDNILGPKINTLGALNFGSVVFDQSINITLEKASYLVDLSANKPLIVLVSTKRSASLYENVAEEFRGKVKLVEVSPKQDLVKVTKKYLRSSSGLIAVPDNEIWSPNNAKWLLYLSYQYRKPVFGFSSSFTRAGAVMSVYSSQRQVAEETAYSINLWLAGKEGWKEVRSPRNYSVDINESVFKVLQMPKSALRKINGGLK